MDQTQNMLSSMMNTNMLGFMSMRNDVSIGQILLGIFIMNLATFFPIISAYINRYIERRFKKTKKQIENLVNNEPEKEIISSIKFIKRNDKDNNVDIIFNALNYYITNNNNSKYLNYSNDFTVTNDEVFKIDEQVYCLVTNDSSNITSEDTEKSYIIKIFSYNLKLSELKNFVDEIRDKYLYEQKNKLGFKKYYFDEKVFSLPRDADGVIRLDNAPKNIAFTMCPFNTNKSLQNIFGKHLNNVKARVDMFLNNKEWYVNKGIPYTLGIMLHGPPGTGKTSLIKAIAKDTNRHVFNIKFNKETTQTQLRNLFFNEKVDVLQNGKTESFNIPINERIYVIEDIDCLTDIVFSRENKSENYEVIKEDINDKNASKNINNSNEIESYNNMNDLYNNLYLECDKEIIGKNWKKFLNMDNNDKLSSVENNYIISDTKDNKVPQPFKKDKNPYVNGEELNLSFILNLLDGILETPGRILIITTNHPEKLDKAFIRPGRIDVNLEVGFCDKEMIEDMFSFFYEKDCKDCLREIEYNKKITPAELNKIVLSNYNNINDALKELKELVE
jgi:DNA polymerase III delta prime subunit